MKRPTCKFCYENDGNRVQAEFVAAQSDDGGTTVDWVLICLSHADGWNEGGDWDAPIFEIGKAMRQESLERLVSSRAQGIMRYKDYILIPRAVHTAVYRPSNVARAQADAVVKNLREAKAWINRDLKG